MTKKIFAFDFPPTVMPPTANEIIRRNVHYPMHKTKVTGNGIVRDELQALIAVWIRIAAEMLQMIGSYASWEML